MHKCWGNAQYLQEFEMIWSTVRHMGWQTPRKADALGNSLKSLAFNSGEEQHTTPG